MHLLPHTALLAGLTNHTLFHHPDKRDQRPDANTVHVEAISFTGTGCPSSSTTMNFTDARTNSSIRFNDFYAYSAPEKSEEDWSKTCDMKLIMRYPQGWTYSVVTTDMVGTAYLPDDCSAEINWSLSFDGQGWPWPNKTSGTAHLLGPYSGPYTFHHGIDKNMMVWSDCNVTAPQLNVHTKVSLGDCAGSTSNALLTVDAQNTFLKSIRLGWMQC